MRGIHASAMGEENSSIGTHSQTARASRSRENSALTPPRRNLNAHVVEGVIEPNQAGHDNNESDEDGENNDSTVRSVQLVAAQTTRAVIEAAHQNRPQKRKRGDVCCRKLIDLMPGEKLHVDFDDDCRPVGEHASIYTYFLGQTVRNRTCCPLQVKEWKHMNPQNLDLAWNVVLEKFSFEDGDLRKEYILSHMNALYRDYRHKLKAAYYDDDELVNQAQRLNNKPKKVTKADWLYLCTYWYSPEFKAISKRNKKNKKSQKLPHYSGAKSYARIADELRKKLKREPTRAEILIASRQRTSSKPVDPHKLAANQNAVSTMKQYMEERREGMNEMTDEQIFTKTVGEDKHGYLRAYGRNKSITDYFGVKPSRLTLINRVTEVEKNADKRVEDATKQLERKLDEKLAERDREHDRKLAERDMIWDERYKRLCEKLGESALNRAPQMVQIS